ncbi:MAG: hypothetical protein IJ751_08595 [Oscillospiraceae bacterium]|nr:hypothetical protein [Oscillospiraceae bacterium]
MSEDLFELELGPESDFEQLLDELDGGYGRAELAAMLARCKELHGELVDAEPSPRRAEAHEAWEDRMEALEDLIDELADRLED